MSGVDDGALRLRAYLVALTPQARQQLGARIEAGAAGSSAAVAEATLAELRRLADDGDGRAVSLFFRPLIPFVVNDEASRRHPGQIAQISLPALWAWLRYDLMPDEAARFICAATEALEAGADVLADSLTHAFQDRVAAALRALFTDEDELARRRLLLRIGTPCAVDEAASVRWILRGRDALAALDARLPASLSDLPHHQIDACRALIEAAARPRELLLYAVLMVMRRLAAPWQIVRLAARVAGSATAARVAETPYGTTIDILLADIERQIAALGTALAGDAASAVALVRAIDATIQGLLAEIDIPVGSTLGRRLSGLRAEAAAVTRAAIAA